MSVQHYLLSVKFKNRELNRELEILLELSSNLRGINLFRIATHLKLVKDFELYKEDGFSSITDYAYKIFGYGKSSVSRMIRVADNYLLKDGSHSIFQFVNGKDFNISQLSEFLVLPKLEIIDLVKQGKIRPEMTRAEIQAKIRIRKDYRKVAEELYGIPIGLPSLEDIFNCELGDMVLGQKIS